MAEIYDLIVIGAGPGGYLPAIEAAHLGKRVAVIEKKELGGTCLNCGCIPTKTLLHTSGLYRELRQGEKLGLKIESLHVDMEQLHQRKDEVVSLLRSGIEQTFKKEKIIWYRGTGVVEDTHKVTVTGTDGQITQLEATYILVATGSQPSVVPIPGVELSGVENSTSLLDKQELYDHLIIIGGGVIGMEFATVYNDLGRQVTVLEAMDKILPGMDKEISQNLKMIMKKRGVDIRTGAMVQSIAHTEQGRLRCSYLEKDQLMEIEADGILIAVGRRSEGASVFSDDCRKQIAFNRDKIIVDENFQTGLPGVYAVGDVIGGIQLAHVATAEGCYAVSHMFGETPVQNLTIIPSCVYTDPEIATAGLTADEAKEAGMEVRTGKYIMSVNAKSVLSMQERGFIKIVSEAATGRVIGAQLMCARATDMIGELQLAMTKGLTAADVAAVVMGHPTFSEGIGEAARLK